MLVGDTNSAEDVFVRDRVGGTTTRISVSTAGVQGNDDSFHASISNDGRFVAFCSKASNLVASDTNSFDDAFLRDRDTDVDGIYDEPADVATIRISEAMGGGESNDFSCDAIRIGGDGLFVTFTSHATNLVPPPDTNSAWDIFVWSRLTAATEVVSVSTGGLLGNSDSSSPSISDDGRFVTFRSFAANLVSGDANGKYDIFLRDRTLATTERTSVAAVQANDSSDLPSVSNDGRYVAFQSKATNLIASDTNNVDDIFVRDRQTSTTMGVTVSGSGAATRNGVSSGPVISATGTYVAFSSVATNLVSGDTNGGTDAFVHQSGPPSILSCATPSPTPSPIPPTPSPTPISGGSGTDSVFTPTTGIKLCNGLPSSGFGDGSVSGSPACADVANDGVTITNVLPSGNVYYSSAVTFVPSGGTPAVGSVGTLAGGVRSAVSVGALNAPCNVSVDEDFVLYNVALPDNVGDPRSSTNIVYPMAIGTADRFSKWKVGSEPTGADPSGIDTGGDPDYAVGTSLAFNNYPSYLLDALDPDFVPGVSDGPAPPIMPTAVYGALTNFGLQWRPLFLVKLAPGAMPAFTAPFPAGVAAKPAMGSALMWVQGDPTDYVPTPDILTDTCSPGGDNDYADGQHVACNRHELLSRVSLVNTRYGPGRVREQDRHVPGKRERG